MSNYPQLIQTILNSNEENTCESLKKLIYLSVNDPDKFRVYALRIAKKIKKLLEQVEDEEIKLLCLQLLSEMATNYRNQIAPQQYNFHRLVQLLSDQNAQVRKASHYLLLIFIKKYEQVDQVFSGYLLRIKECPEHWKIIQKVIHSFQSLLVIQPKCITYSHQYNLIDDFLKMLLAFRNHQHNLIQKASEQTVTSFVKNQYIPQIFPYLTSKVMVQLHKIANKLNLNLQLEQKDSEQEIQEIKITCKQQNFAAKQNSITKGNNKNKQRQKNQISKSKEFKIKQECQNFEIKEAKTKQRGQKQLITNQLQELMRKIEDEDDWKIKSQTIQEINRKIASDEQLSIPSQLPDKILDLTYDYNFKTCINAMNIILTLCTKYSEIIHPKIRNIEDVIIQKICDLKMAVRQIANKILRKIETHSSREFQKKILTKMGNCSAVGKQEIISFLQEVYSVNSPPDKVLLLGQMSAQLQNQNTRIKIKTIDCLVKISLNNNLQQCKNILQKKLNKVYFDMFLDRLRQKGDTEIKWEDKGDGKHINKGMTWQAERTIPNQQADKQFLTKIQFCNKNSNYDTPEDFKLQQDCRREKRANGKNMNATNSTAHKTTNTLDTFKSFEQKPNYKLGKKQINSHPSNSFMNFDAKQEIQQEKKLPMKPNPVKKKNFNEIKEENEPNILVIQSKQYINKNNLEQNKEYTVNARNNKINKTRQKEKQRERQFQKEEEISLKAKQQPFSIKKSTSNKQHQIDYKATHYTSKQQLKPANQPKELLKQIISNLPKDNDWNKQFDCLDGLRRIINHHPEIHPQVQQNLPLIMPQLLKLVESLRSSVAKNGMITLAEMCECFKKSMDPFLQSIFVKLFKKSLDTNSFILQEVQKCMCSLCYYCTIMKIIGIIINNAQSKSIPIKIKVILCIDSICKKQNYDLQILKDNNKIISVMNNFINDGSAQVRNQMKAIFLAFGDNNSVIQLQIFFKKNGKEAWEKWKTIIEKEIKSLSFGYTKKMQYQ